MAIGKISEDLKSAQDYLFKDTTVPVDTTTAGTANLVGGTNGQLEIIAIAKTDITIADTKSITVKLAGSDTEGGSFTDYANLYALTASGGNGAITAGTVLGSYIVTSENPLWAKAVVVTDDATATGTLDVYIKQLVH